MIQPITKLAYKPHKQALSQTSNQNSITNQNQPKQSTALPSVYYTDMISFKGVKTARRTIPDIDYEEYRAMNDVQKKKYRKKAEKFALDVEAKQMFDPKTLLLPLGDEKDMDNFIKISSIYKQYQNQPIVCLGRSPKWFLNAALWMKDGINTYTFMPFSDHWCKNDPVEGMIRDEKYAPTEQEEMEYRKRLRHKQLDPKSIVKQFEKTGKKTVITDYIESGKGICSFLDVLSRFAVDQKVSLEKFANSIEIVAIGSLDYTSRFFHDDEEYSVPEAKMPPLLKPYKKLIKQHYHDMDYRVFDQMLVNRNANECRATYYPPKLWCSYNPDHYKTGMMSEEKMKALKLVHPANGADFTPAMKDYRNLLNFRILDALDQKGLLKDKHKSRS